MRFYLIAALILLSFASQAAPVKIATYNTESDDDTNWSNVAADIGKITGVDIWGLQEVEGQAALNEYLQTAGAGTWKAVISKSGNATRPDRRSDQLAIMYRTDIFRLLGEGEYYAIRSTPGTGKYGRASSGLRALLYIKLLDKQTGKEFYVSNVHLKCCGNGIATREHQAMLMKDWIDRADAPVILLGDFNIPVAPSEAQGPTNSPAFDIINADLVWSYPNNPIKTQCSPRYNSMLDLFFYSPQVQGWGPQSQIMLTTPAYCAAEANGGADHRPVVLTVNVP